MATSAITSRIFDPNTGQGLAGVEVVARLAPVPAFQADGTELVVETRTTTDASGNYTLTLERNADITPANTYYSVREERPGTAGGPVVWQIQVGSIGQSLMAARIVAAPILLDAAYLTQAAADARYAQISQIGGAPVASQPGDTAAAGSGLAVAYSNHRHARESYGVVGDIQESVPGSIAAAGGASARVAAADHRHSFPRAVGRVWSGEKRRTIDHISASTTWVDIDIALDMALPAAVGDIIEVFSSAYWSSEASAGYMDATFLASGVHLSAGGATGAGHVGWVGVASGLSPKFASITRLAGAGDISGGNVTVRLRRRNSAGVTKTLLGAADYPMICWAVNHGPAR